MALELVALTRDEEMAKMIQLVIEPDPQPPLRVPKILTTSFPEILATSR